MRVNNDVTLGLTNDQWWGDTKSFGPRFSHFVVPPLPVINDQSLVFYHHMGMANTNSFSHLCHNGSLVISSKLLRIHNG